jgi:hypothetical protein
MPSRNSHSRPTRSKRIGQLENRLQALTQDYAPFFAGFSAGGTATAWPYKAPSVAILTGLQRVQRVQLACVHFVLPDDEGETRPAPF